MKTKGMAICRRALGLAFGVGLLFAASACGRFNQSPTPLPTVMLGSTESSSPVSIPSSQATGSSVVASGEVVPAQQAQLAFATSGNIAAVSVSMGESVTVGQILAELDTTEVELAVKQAEADVAIAQANLELAQATEPAKIAANIAAAQSALIEAQNALTDLKRNAPLLTAQAQQDLANAQKEFDDAKRRATSVQSSANQASIDAQQAQVVLAKDALDKAKEDFEPYANKPESNLTRANFQARLAAAQQVYDAAVRQLNALLGTGSPVDIEVALADVTAAQAQVDAAQRHWEDVKDGPSAEQLALAEARVTSAQAQLDFANAQTTTQALAQAQLEAAQVRLAQAKAELAKMKLIAPFEGEIAAVNIHPGEWALVGQPGLEIVDLSHPRVETTDLSERDVPQVAVGQAVTVSFKALDQDVSGVVSAISPLADTLGGDVVYKVTIELDSLPEGLRAGMSAEVQFGSNQ